MLLYLCLALENSYNQDVNLFVYTVCKYIYIHVIIKDEFGDTGAMKRKLRLILGYVTVSLWFGLGLGLELGLLMSGV